MHYQTHRLSANYRADFIYYDSVIVELKALVATSNTEAGQIINYLKATRLTRGLLINFGAPALEYKRFIHSQKPQI